MTRLWYLVRFKLSRRFIWYEFIHCSLNMLLLKAMNIILVLIHLLTAGWMMISNTNMIILLCYLVVFFVSSSSMLAPFLSKLYFFYLNWRLCFTHLTYCLAYLISAGEKVCSSNLIWERPGVKFCSPNLIWARLFSPVPMSSLRD